MSRDAPIHNMAPMPDNILKDLADGPAESAKPDPEAAASQPIEEEILVEEISIDGMCGVY